MSIHAAAYCSDGPYRYLTEILDHNPRAWFPWGYAREHLPEGFVGPSQGDRVELWEIDNTRDPTHATSRGVCVVDFVRHTSEYLALTLRRDPSLTPSLEPSSVLAEVRRGTLLFQAGEPAATAPNQTDIAA